MRALQLLLFVFLFSCAQAPIKRVPASEILMRFGEVAHQQSLVKIFPPTFENGSLKYYFYVQLKDPEGKYVDCDPSEISIVTRKGEPIDFALERLFTGRYYLILDEIKHINSSELMFMVRGEALPGSFKLAFNIPDQSLSKVQLVKADNNKLTLRLSLRDKNNQAIETPFIPEILFEGLGEVSELKAVKEGVWEFQVSYPEENQIIYLSVRSQGTYFPKLYRYQYIEK